MKILDLHKKKMLAVFVILIGVAAFLIYTSLQQSFLGSFSGPTPPVANYGSTPIAPESLMPGALDCSKITSLASGPSWNELKIGETTFSEMKEHLEPVSVEWDKRRGNLAFRNDLPVLQKDWHIIAACFIGDKLSALSFIGFRPSIHPHAMNEWITNYGTPRIVTWGEDHYTRSLIWPEDGILIVVDVIDEKVIGVILYPPVKKHQWEKSWLLHSLPKEAYECPGGDEDVPCLLSTDNVEDPWGFTAE